jgi:hypothetical protein
MKKSQAVRETIKKSRADPPPEHWLLIYILEALEEILAELQAQGSDEEEESGPTSLSDRL